MLRSLRALGLAAVAGACSSETVARPAPPPVNWRSLEPRATATDAGTPTPTDRERAAGDAYLQALSTPNFAGLGRLLDEDAHFAFAGMRDVHGRGNAVAMHEALFGAFEGPVFAATRVLRTDRAQILEWTARGVHKATRKVVAFRGLTLLWTKDDGSIADIHLYFDEALPKAQIGSGPKALASVPVPALPAGARQEIEETRDPAETANAALLRGALGALENKDEAAYLATMTDDVEVTTLESAKPLRGKVEIRGYLRAMHKAIGHLDTTIDNVWGIGPFAVVEYHVVGEQRGPIGWIPAQKDNLLKMSAVDVAEITSGKIARVWRYDDPGQILQEPLRDP